MLLDMAKIANGKALSTSNTSYDASGSANGTDSGQSMAGVHAADSVQRTKVLRSGGLWSALHEALGALEESQLQAIPNAMWNENIHIPMMQLVLESFKRPAGTVATRLSGSRGSLAIYCAKMTSQSKPAATTPAALPRVSAGKPDFPIVANASMRGIDHEDAFYIMFDIRADSLATTLAECLENDEESQLSTQAFAHCVDLIAAHGSRYELPIIVVSGKDWRTMVTRAKDDEISLMKKLLIGSSEDMQGINKIIAALRCLAVWVVDVYVFWWQISGSPVNNKVR